MRYAGRTILERSSRDVLSTTEAVQNKHPFHRFRTELLIGTSQYGSKGPPRAFLERRPEAATQHAEVECNVEPRLI